jgi:hypothetical protein
MSRQHKAVIDAIAQGRFQPDENDDDDDENEEERRQ